MKFLIILICLLKKYFFLNIFFFKKFINCHVSVYYHITWQLTIMTRDSGNSCFHFSTQFKFLIQFSTPIF